MHLEDKLKEIYLKSLVGALLFVVLFYFFLDIVFTLIPFPAQVGFLLRAGNRLFLPAINVNVTGYLDKITIAMMLRTSTLAAYIPCFKIFLPPNIGRIHLDLPEVVV